MLSYQHIYHAGNFADVHKHALLERTLSALRARHAALCLIDTHAGRGVYDLSAPEAEKKQEYKNGIHALATAEAPEIAGYLTLVREGGPQAYPGTAAIARASLRPSDRLLLAELHPGEHAILEKNFSGPENIRIVKKDGFALLAESIPPRERRGLAVIDPPYEIKSDYADLPRHLLKAWKKWPQGVFFIWYPLLTDEPHRPMLTALRQTEIKDVLISEIRLKKMPEQGFAMHGSGIAIVSPPFPEPALRAATARIASLLPGEAGAETFWLVNKKIDPETGLIA